MIPRRRGTVKKFNDEKGYGFIAPDEGGKDLFVHYSNVTPAAGTTFRTLREGWTVEFDTIPTERGLACTNVRVV